MPSPGPDEVLVKVTAVGVCGSDTHYYDHGRIGSHVVEQPLVLGHEAAGEIVAVGDGVAPDRIGERVSIEPGRPCFSCVQCLAGRYNLCPEMSFFATPPVDGAFAEHVVVHRALAHPVPSTISDDEAALLEPLSVAIWACGKARVAPGSRVLVTGAGAIGLLCLQVARARGAYPVAISDVNPDRLQLATTLGATDTIDARTTDLPTADVLLECSGHPQVVAQGISSLDRAGRAVLIGMGADELLLPVSVLQERELELTGTFRYANTWPTAIDLVSTGTVNLTPLITSHHSLDDVPAALTEARRTPTALKAVVTPQPQ